MRSAAIWTLPFAELGRLKAIIWENVSPAVLRETSRDLGALKMLKNVITVILRGDPNSGS